MEMLEGEGGLGGSVDPTRKMGHCSGWIKTTKGGSEELKGAESEKQGCKMGGGRSHSSGSTCRSPRSKQKSDTCGIRRNARLRA